MREFRVLDLFSGIGGFSLGLERAGMRTVAFCEIEHYPRAVLRKHWPDVPCYDDIRTLTAERLKADGIVPNVICGGFPCQDISTAGKGAGIDGERSGLWREYARLIGEVRPEFAIVENVAALLGRGLSRVLEDLASLGYDAEWHCIPASYVGAPHRRDRLWIVAYTGHLRGRNGTINIVETFSETSRFSETLADSEFSGLERCGEQKSFDKGGNIARRTNKSSESNSHVSNSNTDSQSISPINAKQIQESDMADVASIGSSESWKSQEQFNFAPDAIGKTIGALSGCFRGQWTTEPNVGRVANGVPARIHRLKGLGNAVVPQIPEMLGRAIINASSGL